MSDDIFNELKKEKDKSKSNDTNPSSNTNTNFTIGSKKDKNRIQRSFYITPQLDRDLDKLKAKTGRDKSELVRIALSHMVENVKVK